MIKLWTINKFRLKIFQLRIFQLRIIKKLKNSYKIQNGIKVDCWFKLHVSQWPCNVIMLVTSEIYSLLKCKMFIHFYLNELSFLTIVIDYARQKRDHFVSIKFCMLSNVIISSIYRHKANDMFSTSRKFFYGEVEIHLNWYNMLFACKLNVLKNYLNFATNCKISNNRFTSITYQTFHSPCTLTFVTESAF